MNILRLLVDFIGVVFGIIILQQLFSSFLKERRLVLAWNIAVNAAIIIILTTATVAGGLYLMPVANLALAFALSFTFRGKLGFRFFLSAAFLLMALATEMIAGALLTFALGVDMVDIQANEVFYMIGMIGSRLFLFLLVKLISYKKIHTYSQIAPKAFWALMLTPISTMIAVYFMGIHMRNYYGFWPMFVMMCTCILMIAANVLVFYLYENQLKAQHAQMMLEVTHLQIKQQAEHYSELSERHIVIRQLSHDMKNNLAGVLGLLEHGEIEDATKQLQKLSGAVQDGAGMFDTGHPAIDALLTAKQQAAQEKQIAFEAQIALPEQLQVDVLDLCVLFGNVLDNALEAREKINDVSKRSILLNIAVSEKYLSIRVDNATAEAETKGRFTTNKADRYFHGFGLESVRSIAARYDGTVNVKHKNHVFTLTVLMKRS